MPTIMIQFLPGILCLTKPVIICLKTWEVDQLKNPLVDLFFHAVMKSFGPIYSVFMIMSKNTTTDTIVLTQKE